ncbi:hypothetical protein OG226_02005 [Streptomyces sp. NBC_01261]|uniref:hypothetical protein n=1 Tax=Streptomyces sp. NBC_01261 TaxID=2903802 RepID=UPI002E320582|nr:hypothetical protein [Streptomyces sp. NBC_01261]
MSLPLVAQDRDGQVVGTLLGVPSGTVGGTVAQLPGYQQHALLSMLKRCVQVYWQLDYMLLFGEFATERDLGPYYRRQGFTVMRPGETIDVGTLLTAVPVQLGAGSGETFFYRWRGNVR